MLEKALSHSSRKFGIDAHYLLKGGLLVGIASTIAFINTFVVSILFANFVSPEIYGTYKFIFSIIGFLACFSLTGVVVTISKSVAQNFEGTYLYLVKKHLLFSVIPIVLTLPVSGYYLLQDNLTLASGILIAGLISPILRTVNLYGAFLEGKKQFSQNVKFQFFYSVLPTVILVSTIVLNGSLIQIIFNFLIAQLVVNTVIAFLAYKSNKPNNLIDPKASNFSKHLTLMGFIGAVSVHIDKILIFHFFGAIAVAMYTVATAIPLQSNVVTKGFKSLIFPKLSSRSIVEIKKVIVKRALVMLLLSVFLLISYVLLAPYIFKIFFPQYVDGILLSQVYALSFLFIPTMLYKFSFYAHTQTKELYKIKIIPPLVTITLMLFLLPIFNLWGAVAATLIGRLIETILFIVLFHTKVR